MLTKNSLRCFLISLCITLSVLLLPLGLLAAEISAGEALSENASPLLEGGGALKSSIVNAARIADESGLWRVVAAVFPGLLLLVLIVVGGGMVIADIFV